MSRDTPAAERPALINRILARIEDGQSGKGACRAEGTNLSSLLFWIHNDEANGNADRLADRYARARRWGTESLVDDIQDAVANAGSTDPQLVKIMVDAFKWIAVRRHPALYGDRVQHAGADGTGPAITEVRYSYPTRPAEGSE